MKGRRAATLTTVSWPTNTLRHCILTATALTSACVMGPPIRTGHYGAPGRMEAGMVEANAGATWSGLEISGGPMLGYGITDAVAVEAGAEAGSSERAIGYAGVRYTPLRPEGRDFAFTLDLESGVGAGVGGSDFNCDPQVDETCVSGWQRTAGGGYLGIGIGGKIKWFSPWLRVRTQASVAEGIPITSLTTAGVGVQFSIARLAHIYLGTGAYVLVNQYNSFWGWAYLDGGLSFTIATPRTKRLREQRARLQR